MRLLVWSDHNSKQDQNDFEIFGKYGGHFRAVILKKNRHTHAWDNEFENMHNFQQLIMNLVSETLVVVISYPLRHRTEQMRHLVFIIPNSHSLPVLEHRTKLKCQKHSV